MKRYNILLIENDPSLLGLLVLELELKGYQVQGYPSAEEALVAPLEPLNLAILDYQLPGMDGLTLLGRLRQNYPSLPALIISSECTEDRMRSGPGPATTQLLRKPFAQEAFMTSVATLLK